MSPIVHPGNAYSPTSAGASPRVGIPWRTSEEERDGERRKLDYYFQSVRNAGAEPVEISLLQTPSALQSQLSKLDAFILPGSPADVDPARYGSAKHSKTNNLDEYRDRTDTAILEHVLESGKPVLAICYGCQILNVFSKGTLIQDIHSERPSSGAHGLTDLPPGAKLDNLRHPVVLAPGSRLARLNQSEAAEINSSHHQAIDQPGENLRVTARAADGIIEGVEHVGDGTWIVGVQWHPERMPESDAFSRRLFQDFAAAARARMQQAVAST